jgi:ABC-type nitrate/sulfonate/bicarbonate transport system substrate-binding protein
MAPTKVNPTRRRFVHGAMIGTGFALAPSIVSGQSSKLGPTKVFIGSNPSFGGIMIADQKKFFEQEGLSVELTYFASGATAVDAFRAGRGDVVGAGDLPSLRLWQQNGVGLCPLAIYGDLSVVVAKKSIAKPADLKGKKVGVLLGGTVEYFAKLWLASGGIDLKDVEVINLRPMEMVAGLTRGDIDAFVVFQPFGWMAIKADPDAHIVTTAEPYFREWLVVNTTPEYAKSHPAELNAFLKSLDRSGEWIVQNMDEATQLIGKSLRMDDLATVKMMLQTINWKIAFTRKFRSDMDNLAKFFNVPIDWKKSFDSAPLAKLGPSFVET